MGSRYGRGTRESMEIEWETWGVLEVPSLDLILEKMCWEERIFLNLEKHKEGGFYVNRRRRHTRHVKLVIVRDDYPDQSWNKKRMPQGGHMFELELNLGEDRTGIEKAMSIERRRRDTAAVLSKRWAGRFTSP